MLIENLNEELIKFSLHFSGFINGKAIDVKSAKIVAGLEVEKTNRLLNELAKCALDKKPFLDPVDKVHKKQKPPTVAANKTMASNKKSVGSVRTTQVSTNNKSKPTNSRVAKVPKVDVKANKDSQQTNNNSSMDYVEPVDIEMSNKTGGNVQLPVDNDNKDLADNNELVTADCLNPLRNTESIDGQTRVGGIHLDGQSIEDISTQNPVGKNTEQTLIDQQDNSIEHGDHDDVDGGGKSGVQCDPQQQENSRPLTSTTRRQSEDRISGINSNKDADEIDADVSVSVGSEGVDGGGASVDEPVENPTDNSLLANDIHLNDIEHNSMKDTSPARIMSNTMVKGLSRSSMQTIPSSAAPITLSNQKDTSEGVVSGSGETEGKSKTDRAPSVIRHQRLKSTRSSRPSSSRPAPPRVMTASKSRLSQLMESRMEQFVSGHNVNNMTTSLWPPVNDLKVEDGSADDYVISSKKLQETLLSEEDTKPAGDIGDETNDKGHLVQQLLATKSELEGKTLTDNNGLELDNRSTFNDTKILQSHVQQLCQSVGTLSKALNYLHEDVDPMMAELTKWRDEYRANVVLIRKIRMETQKDIEPLKKELQVVEKEAADFIEQLLLIKSSVFRNSQTIAKLIETV